MKKSSVYFATFLLISFSLSQIKALAKNPNSVGLDIGGFIINTPQNKLPGDKYNAYISSSSSMVGIYYQRDFTRIKVKSGFYLNKQFFSLVSMHLPIEIKGVLAGNPESSIASLNYIGGLSINFLNSIVHGFRFFDDDVISYDIEKTRNNYIAPHVGLNTGLNIGKVNLSGDVLFHFLIPKIVSYHTQYNLNGEITNENNSNNSWGISFRFGAAFSF